MGKRRLLPGGLKFNKPYPSTRRDKKKMVFVFNPKTGRVNTIHFGQKGYKSNYSKIARTRYLKRSAGIKNKKGKLTKNNPLSANYWARKILWGAK
jgi:hypothetical protein